MAFKMNGFSGFKDVGDTVEYGTEKVIKKGVGDQIGKTNGLNLEILTNFWNLNQL